jgi:hypothetical protein
LHSSTRAWGIDFRRAEGTAALIKITRLPCLVITEAEETNIQLRRLCVPQPVNAFPPLPRRADRLFFFVARTWQDIRARTVWRHCVRCSARVFWEAIWGLTEAQDDVATKTFSSVGTRLET